MKLGKDHWLANASNCIDCGKLLNGATAIDSDSAPDPGDVTVCIYCGSLMIFEDDLSLRRPQPEEIVEMAGDERILAMQQARKEMDEP